MEADTLRTAQRSELRRLLSTALHELHGQDARAFEAFLLRVVGEREAQGDCGILGIGRATLHKDVVKAKDFLKRRLPPREDLS